MIERTDYERYEGALRTNATLAQSAVMALATDDLLSLDAQAFRDFWVQSFPSVVEKYGQQAALTALDFYQAQREKHGVTSEYIPSLYASVDYEYTYGIVSRTQEKAASNVSCVSALSNEAVRLVNAQADSTIIVNTQNDPAHPKWALVPHVGACGWCVMLGSQGFHYRAQERVPRHASCKCAVAVDFDTSNPRLEGYDPDQLYKAYSDARKTIEDDAKRTWKAMSAEQKAKYTRNGKVSYDAYLRNRTAREMDTRDRDWLQTGKAPEIAKENGAIPKKKENKVAEILCEHGYNVTFLRPTGQDGTRTADLMINSAPWEIKQPVGNASQQIIGKNTLDHQFEEAVGQSKRLILDLTAIESYASVGNSAKYRAFELFNGKWHKRFDELILVTGGGLLRYKNV